MVYIIDEQRKSHRKDRTPHTIRTIYKHVHHIFQKCDGILNNARGHTRAIPGPPPYSWNVTDCVNSSVHQHGIIPAMQATTHAPVRAPCGTCCMRVICMPQDASFPTSGCEAIYLNSDIRRPRPQWPCAARALLFPHPKCKKSPKHRRMHRSIPKAAYPENKRNIKCEETRARDADQALRWALVPKWMQHTANSKSKQRQTEKQACATPRHHCSGGM